MSDFNKGDMGRNPENELPVPSFKQMIDEHRKALPELFETVKTTGGDELLIYKPVHEGLPDLDGPNKERTFVISPKLGYVEIIYQAGKRDQLVQELIGQDGFNETQIVGLTSPDRFPVTSDNMGSIYRRHTNGYMSPIDRDQMALDLGAISADKEDLERLKVIDDLFTKYKDKEDRTPYPAVQQLPAKAIAEGNLASTVIDSTPSKQNDPVERSPKEILNLRLAAAMDAYNKKDLERVKDEAARLWGTAFDVPAAFAPLPEIPPLFLEDGQITDSRLNSNSQGFLLYLPRVNTLNQLNPNSVLSELLKEANIVSVIEGGWVRIEYIQESDQYQIYPSDFPMLRGDATKEQPPVSISPDDSYQVNPGTDTSEKSSNSEQAASSGEELIFPEGVMSQVDHLQSLYTTRDLMEVGAAAIEVARASYALPGNPNAFENFDFQPKFPNSYLTPEGNEIKTNYILGDSDDVIMLFIPDIKKLPAGTYIKEESTLGQLKFSADVTKSYITPETEEMNGMWIAMQIDPQTGKFINGVYLR